MLGGQVVALAAVCCDEQFPASALKLTSRRGRGRVNGVLANQPSCQIPVLPSMVELVVLPVSAVMARAAMKLTSIGFAESP